MKKLFIFSFFIFSFFQNSAQNSGKNNFFIGANIVTRQLPHFNYYYPRLSFEYSFHETSSFEVLLEYINHKPQEKKVISYPISAGYKLNVLPWLVKNENITNRFKLYNSLRYVLLFSPSDSSTPLSDLRTFHHIRYAPGIDYYFNRNWGANFEMVFGQSMKTTLGVGLKYKF